MLIFEKENNKKSDFFIQQNNELR